MSIYEIVFVVRPDVSTDQVKKVTDRLKDIIKEKGGKVEKQEDWGLKAFAYRIKKYARGYYTMLICTMTGEALTELERNINLSEDVIRHLIVKVDEVEEGPSVMMKRNERENAAAQQ